MTVRTGMLAAILGGVLALAGCSGTSPDTSPLSAISGELSGTITESGSSTVQPLAEKLANAFTARYPKVKITIQGGGTGVGIKSAYDGTVDIGAASRELTQDDPVLLKHLLARDGIAIIVNLANPLDNLSRQQVIDIFSGNITNWNQVGGNDREIHVAAREEGSGTRTAFQEMILGKNKVVKNAVLQSSSGAILQVVKSDAQAISFDSFGYVVDGVKALSVEGVLANEINARNGLYPLVRPLYFLTKAQPAGLVKEFLDFCGGPEARDIISGEGYIPPVQAEK